MCHTLVKIMRLAPTESAKTSQSLALMETEVTVIGDTLSISNDLYEENELFLKQI